VSAMPCGIDDEVQLAQPHDGAPTEAAVGATAAIRAVDSDSDFGDGEAAHSEPARVSAAMRAGDSDFDESRRLCRTAWGEGTTSPMGTKARRRGRRRIMKLMRVHAPRF
jgi:hypothetical protein